MRSVEINGRRHPVDGPDEMPLLWVLRDLLGFTGTKYGCGAGQCGACSVLEDGRAVRSCQLPLAATAGHGYVTVEALDTHAAGRALRQAWVELDVAQCGYCQPGFLIAAADLIARRPQPTDAEIDGAFAAHLCRCGTYPRLRQAVRRAAETLRSTTVASGS